MKFQLFTAAVSLCSFVGVQANYDVMKLVEAAYDKSLESGFYARESSHKASRSKLKKCKDGKVTIDGEDFPCDNVDFYSFLPLTELDPPYPDHGPRGSRAADIWGWVSPSGREFTLISLDNGVAVVDTSRPTRPCVIAKMPTGRYVDIWADVKVYNNTMYHVKDTSYFRSLGLDSEPEETNTYGIEVYDLLQLDQLSCRKDDYIPLLISPNFIYSGHGRSHNLVVNPESGYLYSVGTEKCAGGFIMLDVKTDRLKPTDVGCISSDGYTHDGQCLTYDGPDPDYQGREICFGFNEDTLTIFDVTDPVDYKMISRTLYPNQVYSHQGWVNDKLTKILLDDELDEACNMDFEYSRRCAASVTGLSGLKTTSTNIFDITDLDNPIFEGFFDHGDLSIDHNLYVWGTVHRKGWGGSPPMKYHPDPNFAYMNNYLAGLKIVNIKSDDISEWETAGYFDVAPEVTEITFAGAWSGYMHPSGVYALSSIERGLFLLRPKMAFTKDYPKRKKHDDDSDDSDSDDSDSDEDDD